MSRLLSKKYTLAFRIPLDDECLRNNIKLPSGEKWTLRFTKHYLFIRFGTISEDGEWIFNVKSITKLQKRLPRAELRVWNFKLYQNDESDLPFRNTLDEDVVTFTLSGQPEVDGELYKYVPELDRFAKESEFEGDSFPSSSTTEHKLDFDLDKYSRERDIIMSRLQYTHFGH